jgi:hypothetical protein
MRGEHGAFDLSPILEMGKVVGETTQARMVLCWLKRRGLGPGSSRAEFARRRAMTVPITA